MEFRILGPLEVYGDGGAVPVGGARQRALLAILILHANEVVPVERLLDDLWGERQPTSGAKALHVSISQLRKALGDGRILTRAPGYVLRLESTELDVLRAERLLAQAESAEPHEASALLRDALSLWRGPPLAEVAYETFAQPEIARLEELRIRTIEQRIDADLALGRHGELVGELEALVQEHPLRERLRAQLMLALYRSGRQAEALTAYQRARSVLVDELGIEPGQALRELHQAILRHDAAIEPAAPRNAPAATRGAFVGRKAELDELLAGLDDAIAGRGRLFLLVGEPGIGKSRLAEELAARASARGARILVGRCWEAGGAPAYWPWVESLRRYVRDTEPAELPAALGPGAAEIAQLVPEIRSELPELSEASTLESEGARFRLFDAVAELLRNASDARPIVLVLDDLHAADAPSLLLLQFLARKLDSTRLLVLGAYRDVDPVPREPLTGVLAEVAREPVTRRLFLRGLSELDVEELVERTASELASPELVAAIQERTEGNPLFVGETMRLLVSEGVGAEADGRAEITVPQTVRDVITRRVDRLSERCNRILVLASILGRDFSLGTLARVAEMPEVELLETLDEAMAARIVADHPAAHGRLRFAHVLIRDTLYDSLTTAGRIRFHRQAISALESSYAGEPGPELAELAHHAIAGHDVARGLRYARRAGDYALELLAFEEAARLYEAALEALELVAGADDATRCELLLSLGEAESRAGSSAAAREAFLAAAEVARKLGLSCELARAAAGYGGRIVFARAAGDALLVPLLEEGLAALGGEDVRLRARLLARLAGALRDEHSRERRDALSAEALALARRTGNAEALADALNGRVAAILAPDTLAECLALGTELRDLAERIGDREGTGHGHVLRVHALVQLGDLRQAETDLAAAVAIARDLRQAAHLWEVRGIEAMLALAAGRLDEAEEIAAQALAVGERAQPVMAIPVFQLQRYTLCELRGGLGDVEPAIRGLAAEYPARPVFRCALAHLDATLGRLTDAKRALDELVHDDCSALPFDTEWLYGVSLLAETCGILGDSPSAAVLYELLQPWSGLNVADVAEGIRGSVDRYLGVLATTTARWTDAERHFEDAVGMNERMGVLPWLARTQADYARMLRMRGGAGDRRRVGELDAAARTAYRELGLEPAGAVTAPTSH
jgi:DNA-binding SARP family transcriptional activator